MKEENYLKKKKLYEDKIRIINTILEVKEKNTEILEKKDYIELEELIFRAYIEFENTVEVAKYINETGYRIQTDTWRKERKYIGKDITNILKSDCEIDTDIRQVVAYMLGRDYLVKNHRR